MSNVYLYLYVFLWHNNKLYSISSSKVPFINAQEKFPLLLPYGSGLHILIHHPHNDNKYSCNININKMYWRHFFHPYLLYIVISLFMRLMSDFAQWWNFRTNDFSIFFNEGSHWKENNYHQHLFLNIQNNCRKKHLFVLSFSFK